MNAPLVFLDVETTGLHSDLRQIWEVGMIRRDHEGENELQFFVEADLAMADPFALKIGGFYERSPQGKWLTDRRAHVTRPSYWYTEIAASLRRLEPEHPPEVVHPESYWPHGRMVSRYDAAGIVAKWTHGAHLVGAVPSFDAESLTDLLRENQATPGWHYHLIDVENLAVGYLQRAAREAQYECTSFVINPPGATGTNADLVSPEDVFAATLPPWDSEQLACLLDVEITEEDRHTALGDARWAMRMYDAVMGT